MSDRNRSIRNRRAWYAVLLVVALVLLVFAFFEREVESIVIGIPTIFVIADALRAREDSVRIPPLLVGLVVLINAMLVIGRTIEGQYAFFQIITDLLMGIFLDLVGLIVVYVMMRVSPSSTQERPFFIALTSFCVGVSLFVILALVTYFIEMAQANPQPGTTARFFSEVFGVIIGAAVMTCFYYLNRHNNLLARSVNQFLSDNAEQLGIADREEEEVRRLIAGGESSKAEFKSTLRTNLKTGEKDARMEHAALKTVVAFLNSKGGTLLIGVADDGTVLGADVASFESRDRFLLHFNNLINSQIGSEYLPFINYGLVDLDGKPVLRVVCRRSETPVFLKENGEMTFFVRSGPSSIDLHGMDLLYYADHNFGRMLRRPVRKNGPGGR